MRDDVLGLASFRTITFGPAPRPLPLPKLPTTANRSFATELKLASTQPFVNKKPFVTPRPLAAPKPYVSPMKRSTMYEPPSTSKKPTTVPTRPPTTNTTTSSSRPTTTLDQSKPSALTAPEATPEVPRTPDASILAGAMALGAYPHPHGDNGRGMHWVPTTRQDNATVDRFVAEAQRMGVKWVTFLNNGATIGDNDYLVTKLVAAHIEPLMRLYSATVEPLQGDIEGMVRHYTAMGVHYFQPFNEPNLNVENPDGKVSVDRYLNAWIPAARAIVRGGGLPGFGSMAPGGDYDDQQFLTAALAGLKARGETSVLDKAWLSMHNYTWNHPINDRGDGDGFFKFRAYHSIVHGALGRDLPIIGTEGGTFAGSQEDLLMPRVTPGMAANWTQDAFRYMRDKREPWMFASSVWTIADLAGGGSDARFEEQALFKADGSQNSIVTALQALG
jgi:hypothetical protein